MFGAEREIRIAIQRKWTEMNFKSLSVKSSALAIAFSACLALAGTAFAQTSEIELNDGSVIQGKVVSFANGVYKIQTNSMGVVSIPEAKINSIHKRGASRSGSAPAVSSSGNVQQQIESMKSQMMSDPKTLERIQSLQNNPAVQRILKDPNLMKAIQQGDLNQLGQNSDIQSLMNDQKVREIFETNR
ncbi:MAG: hypothetical protein G3M78_05400 [Candidatus Nitrohelix vancouverensis]|uniref:STI1 domain-containing protein n=1 Tax=Candidatus Nitrohelix vancouverensis TaxID=2705534 RepID=A0A7T0G2Y9_9BACT|nr:MAG: hypothetical protein G3M78_05400 [Candidatus Nitrohelix vancouverensis]